jgi:putative hydrolase of the HAD superfamily
VSEIRTIIFDLSEVLIAGLFGIEGPLAEQLCVSGSAILPAFGGSLLDDLCCARLTEDEYLERIISRQGWNTSPAHLKPVIRRNFHRRVAGMQRVVDRLKLRYELVLLSDHAREWIAYIQEVHSVFNAFGELFFSYELGQTKSDPTTFVRVLDRLGQTAERCLLVDDSERNVAAARSVGINSVRFVDATQLVRTLHRKGLEV